MLTLAALVLVTDSARADGYSGPAYSGGTYTVNGTTCQDGGGGGGASGSNVSCSGAITATFTWSGTSSPPQNVIVMQSASASAGALRQGPGNDPSAACADGLGDTCSITTTNPSSPPGSEGKSGSASKTQYTTQSGSSSLTLTCSASASASVPMQPSASASVSYSAQVYPVTISLGGATSDGNGGQAILVGQHCTASLGGIPNGCVASNWQWSISGDTFQSWSPSTPTSETDGPGSLTNSSAVWYWKDQTQTPETVSCTATVTPPAGQGSAFTVTAMQKVTVYVPTWTATGTGGQMSVAFTQNVGWNLIATPTVAGETGGMDFNLSVTTPPSPAFGTGTLAMIQIISSPFQSYQWSSTDYKHLWSDNGHPGLDSNTFYTLVSHQSTGTTYSAFTRDSPGINLTLPDGTDPFYWASDQNGFTDTLMYLPPVPASAPNSVSMYVPLASFGWSVSGSATIPMDMKWSDYAAQNNNSSSAGTVTPSGSPSKFTATSTFPKWTKTDLSSDNYN